MNTTTPAVGEVWRDVNRRYPAHMRPNVRILAVDDTHATAVTVHDDPDLPPIEHRIHLSRFGRWFIKA